MLWFTLAAAALGVMSGYLFAWSVFSSSVPSAQQIATYLGVVFGGTTITLLNQFDSPYKLPAYVLGVAAGFLIYMIVLHLNKAKVLFAISVGAIKCAPLFPWRLDKPCYSADCQHWPNTRATHSSATVCCNASKSGDV